MSIRSISPGSDDQPADKRARIIKPEDVPSVNRDDLPLGCVILIECTSTSPDFLYPWMMRPQSRCSGSGFVVNTRDGYRILTNFHVVEDAIDVRLRKHGISRRWRGKVVASGPDVDLAVIDVHEEELGKGEAFWEKVTPAMWHGTLPNLQDEVRVSGYPTGGSTISVTQGVVSRIDCKNYHIGNADDFNPGGILVLQIDAAINSGNSGGPAFATDGTVVGVAFQSLGGNADGIGYLIPAQVCQNFLAATANGQRYGGIADVPFQTRKLENPSLRRRHRVAEDVTGVLVTKVSPHSAIPILTDDVLVTVDGKSIGNDGSVELRESELVDHQCLFTCKPAGESTRLGVLRGGERIELSATLRPLPHVVPRTNGFDCSAEYVIIGGLVFTRLVCPMLEDKRTRDKFAAVFDLIYYQLGKNFAPAVPPGEEGQQVLVLTDILSAPLNYGYKANQWSVLSAVNGKRVHSLRGLYRAYMEYAGEFFEFKFSHGGEGVVLGAKECRESEEEILRMHAVPAIASLAVRESVDAGVLQESAESATVVA